AASVVALESVDPSRAWTAPNPEGRNQSYAARNGRLCGAVEHISGLASFRRGEQFFDGATCHVSDSVGCPGRLSVDGRGNAPAGSECASCAGGVGGHDHGESGYIAGELVAASVRDERLGLARPCRALRFEGWHGLSC